MLWRLIVVFVLHCVTGATLQSVAATARDAPACRALSALSSLTTLRLATTSALAASEHFSSWKLQQVWARDVRPFRMPLLSVLCAQLRDFKGEHLLDRMSESKHLQRLSTEFGPPMVHAVEKVSQLPLVLSRCSCLGVAQALACPVACRVDVSGPDGGAYVLACSCLLLSPFGRNCGRS